MSKLVILKGLPASGKSKYAIELVAQGYKRVNKDDLRSMIDSSVWSKENEKNINFIEFHIVAYYLANQYDVVVDDTNFTWEDRWVEEGKAHGAEVEVKFFDTPVMECIERDAKRGDKSVGTEVIMRMYDQYLKPKKQEPDSRLIQCFIFDIDGTLAHMNNRSPYDFSKVSTDSLDTHVGGMCKILEQKYPIIVLSGREETCRKETEEWLSAKNIKYEKLLMRSSGDKRKDSIVKQEIYEKEIKPYGYQVMGVFDDRNQVVDMWRSLGLTCYQVAYGFF